MAFLYAVLLTSYLLGPDEEADVVWMQLDNTGFYADMDQTKISPYN